MCSRDYRLIVFDRAVQAVGMLAEYKKNALPRDDMEKAERREINAWRDKLIRDLRMYYFGKKRNRYCFDCPLQLEHERKIYLREEDRT